VGQVKAPTTTTPSNISSVTNFDINLPVNPGTSYAKMGNDNLVETLAARLDNITDKKVRRENLRAADLILSIESKLALSQELEVDTVRVGQSSADIAESLGGSLVNQRATLHSLKSSDPSLTGSFQCLDKHGAEKYRCYTGFIDLRSLKTGAEVNAIVRHSNAMIKIIKGNGVAHPSLEYQRLMEFFRATMQDATNQPTIHTIYFETTEVVHGKTMARISMVGSGDQVIGLVGSLKVAGKSAPFAEGVLMKDIREQSLIYLIDDKSKVQTDLQDLIVGAHLRNEGDASEYTLVLDVVGTAEEPHQSIELRLKRDFYPVNPL
jgi:hypothetical protein